MKNLLTLARKKEMALGFYIGDTNVTVAEMAIYARFDYMRIDCEHTLANPSKIQDLIRVASAADVPTLVRISSYSDITKLLDYGDSGILVPDISNANQVREAVRLRKYAPIRRAWNE